jgi:hypothetical protein
MSNDWQEPQDSEEGQGNPVVASDDVADEYDLADTVEADYYGTDEDESQEATA